MNMFRVTTRIVRVDRGVYQLLPPSLKKSRQINSRPHTRTILRTRAKLFWFWKFTPNFTYGTNHETLLYYPSFFGPIEIESKRVG